MQLYFFKTKLPNLKLKTQPKQPQGSLPLVILAYFVTVVSYFDLTNNDIFDRELACHAIESYVERLSNVIEVPELQNFVSTSNKLERL